MYPSMKNLAKFFLLTYCILVSVLCEEHSHNPDCISDPLHLPSTTVPLDLFSLPASYAAAAASLPADLTVQLQIRNTLALYPLAIDGKNFAALNRVFTCDVVANYSAPLNVIADLYSLQAVLKESLSYVITQHSFATQVIDVLEGGCEAKSLTYFTAAHFGQGDYIGQVRFNECYEI